MIALLRLSYILILQPFLLSLSLIVSLFHKKLRNSLRLKLNSKISDLKPQSKAVWFHCASGEFEYALPLIRHLKDQQEHTSILVTYSSPSYEYKIRNCEWVDEAYPLPLDLPGSVNNFLLHVKPKMLIIARTDLWPELLYQCRQLKIPTVLIAKTQQQVNPILKPFTAKLFNLLDCIFAVSKEDKLNLQKLNLKTDLQIAPDTRYEQVLHRLTDQNINVKHQLKPDESLPTFLAGSTWPEDEKVLLPCLIESIKHTKLQAIIAPHEPSETHLVNLERAIESQKGESQRYTEAENFDPNKILIIDEVGLLAKLYTWTQLSFIGGSFKSKTHSVMEALAAGNLVCLGPKNYNNREAQVFKKLKVIDEIFAVTEVQNSNEFKAWINKNLDQKQVIQHELVSEKIKASQGSSKLIYDYLLGKNWL